MTHLFLETNWLVDVACPEPFRVPAAVGLLDDARSGRLRLHVPSVSFSEARKAIRNRFRVGREVNAIRRYLTAGIGGGAIEPADAEVGRTLLQRYEHAISSDLRRLEERLSDLRACDGVYVFALTDQMYERAIELSLTPGVELDPFDNSILAAVLVMGASLRDAGESDVRFAEMDGDLQPWNRDGSRREPLCSLYDAAHVWVHGTFTLDDRVRPEGW